MRFLPKREKKYFSFLFQDNNLKIAKLDTRGVRLISFLEFPLPSGLIVGGEVREVDKLGDFLLKVREQTKIKDKFIVVGIPEIKASIHTLTLPSLSAEEIDEAIKFRADSFLPFPYKDEYLDWMLIRKTKEGKKRILLSAVPKRVIDGFVSSLEKAHFSPIAFETTSLSLFRLLPPEGRNLSFAAEIGETFIVLILSHQGNIEACSVIREKNSLLETIEKMRNFYFPT